METYEDPYVALRDIERLVSQYIREPGSSAPVTLGTISAIAIVARISKPKQEAA